METGFHKSEINYGVFTTSDIATILTKDTRTVARYLKLYGDSRFGKVIFKDTYSWEVNGIRAVNFFAFIELAVFFRLHEEYGLTIKQINDARAIVASTLNTPYPLATAPILTGEKKIFYEYLDDILRADKKHKNQVTMKTMIRPLLDKIEFDDNTNAKIYFPLGKGTDVVVDPLHQFGSPTIRGTNIRVDILGRMNKNGEDENSLQKLYELTPKQVNDALRYYKQAA